MKVLWLTNIPSPYRVSFFNELGKYCELTVLFERRASMERDNSWGGFEAKNFKAVFLKGIKVKASNAFCPEVVKYLKKGYDHIVVGYYIMPTGMTAVLTMKLKGISYEIETDGGFPGSGRGVKELFKKFLLSNARLYFSTSEMNDRYFKTYGVKKKRIRRYPFTSVEAKDVLKASVDESEKKKLREKLGMVEEHVVVAVGQFIKRKGFDTLIEAYDGLNENTGVYIVGGKPTEEYIKMAQNRNRIHFVGFKQKKELAEYYKAADVFALPTREDVWGLVVNEAMAYGLPVVTTDRCIAGLEMVKDGVNGKLVNVEDKKELSAAINECIDNYYKYSEGALKKAGEYTIEEMAKSHLKIWAGEMAHN